MRSRLLIFLCGIWLVKIIEAGIIERPVSMTAFLNTNVTFNCSAIETTVFWIVDGTRSTDTPIEQRGIQTPSTTRMFTGDTMARLIVLASASNNNTRLRCGVITGEGEKLLGDEVILKVQGLLAAPRNLTIEALGENTVILSWSPPFTLDVSDTDPDITGYRVHIFNYNTSNQEMKSTAANVTEFKFVINDQSHLYEFSVSALNEVGEGNQTDPVSTCPRGNEDFLEISPSPTMTTHPTHDVNSILNSSGYENYSHSVTPLSDAQYEQNKDLVLIVIPVVVPGVLIVILIAAVLFVILIKKHYTRAVDVDDSLRIQMKRNCAYEDTQIHSKIQLELNSAYGVLSDP